MKPGRIIMAVAGAVMIVSLFIDWAKNPDPLFDDRTGNHPFKYPLGAAAWLIIVLVGILALLLATGVLKREQAPWSTILLGGAALGTVLMVIQVFTGGGDETIAQVGRTFDLDPYTGMYIAVAAAVVSLIGAIIEFAGERSSQRTV